VASVTINFTNPPTVLSSTSTTFTVNGTINVTPALNLAVADVEAQVSYNGATNSATNLQLSPTTPPAASNYNWTATLPFSGQNGQLVWVVILVTPPDNSQPKSNSAQYQLPVPAVNAGAAPPAG
jgi:hypothetical protein